MFHKPKAQYLVLVSMFAFLGFVFTACATNDDITIQDKKEVQGENVKETLRADNSLGSTPLMQDLTAKKQYSREITIVPNPGEKFDTNEARQKILDNYNLNEGPAEQVCVIPVEVPAGNIYEYDLEWSEVKREGIIEIGSPDGEPEGTYQFVQSMTCQVVGQRVIK